MICIKVVKVKQNASLKLFTFTVTADGSDAPLQISLLKLYDISPAFIIEPLPSLYRW